VWSADAVSAADEGRAAAACPSVSSASLQAPTSGDASGTRCRSGSETHDKSKLIPPRPTDCNTTFKSRLKPHFLAQLAELKV